MIVTTNIPGEHGRAPHRPAGTTLWASIDVEWTKNYRIKNGNRPFCYSVVYAAVPDTAASVDLSELPCDEDPCRSATAWSSPSTAPTPRARPRRAGQVREDRLVPDGPAPRQHRALQPGRRGAVPPRRALRPSGLATPG